MRSNWGHLFCQRRFSLSSTLTVGILQYKPIQSAKYCNLIGQLRATELDYIVKCPQCIQNGAPSLRTQAVNYLRRKSSNSHRCSFSSNATILIIHKDFIVMNGEMHLPSVPTRGLINRVI